MGNDYFLVAAAPVLVIGIAFLQSGLHQIYGLQNNFSDADGSSMSRRSNALRRIVAAVEMMWIATYLVKFCYLAQFKFYKAPYRYVDPNLTAYYWAAVGLCVTGFLFTIAQPIILCPSPGTFCTRANRAKLIRLDECRYLDPADTGKWEAAVTAIDIVTDLLGQYFLNETRCSLNNSIVVSVPAVLILNTKSIRSHTIANFVFKSLSILHIAVAAARLALQYDAEDRRVQYATVTFLLAVEAAVAIVTVSISSYRVVFLEHLAAWQRGKGTQPTCLPARHHPTAAAGSGANQADNAKATEQDGSMSELPILSQNSA